VTVEDYDKASASYAENRNAVGIDIILGATLKAGILPKLASLVDLGCGAGKYSVPLSNFFKSVVGIDQSKGQLEQAKKTGEYQQLENVTWVQSDIRSIPDQPSSSQDVALCSLVLHHIRSENGDHFSEQKKALDEGIRLLRNQGVFIIATCSHEQIARGAWYCEVMPERIIQLRQSYYTTFERLDKFMVSRGFKPAGRFIDVGTVLHGEQYSNYENVFSAEYRRTDSIFSSLTETETSSFLQQVRSLKDSGKIHALLEANQETLKRQGQVTFLVYKGV
jgi:ubiquinone/menaquinone biosynthesis C-methylase UbiE